MISKLFICPYFGPLPEWMPLWERNFDRLRDDGYEVLIERDEDGFRARVKRVLGIECPPMTGTGNIWDFRAAFGELYAPEIEGYDFWGHTDFDVVYGRVEQWVTDEFLDSLDVHSNHLTYQCGCWSLYRNIPFVNSFFRRCYEWRDVMESPDPTGWVEAGFSVEIDWASQRGELRKQWTNWQTRSLDNFDGLTLDRETGALYEPHSDPRIMLNEVMMAHFRRTKVYPEGCR